MFLKNATVVFERRVVAVTVSAGGLSVDKFMD